MVAEVLAPEIPSTKEGEEKQQMLELFRRLQPEVKSMLADAPDEETLARQYSEFIQVDEPNAGDKIELAQDMIFVANLQQFLSDIEALVNELDSSASMSESILSNAEKVSATLLYLVQDIDNTNPERRRFVNKINALRGSIDEILEKYKIDTNDVEDEDGY